MPSAYFQTKTTGAEHNPEKQPEFTELHKGLKGEILCFQTSASVKKRKKERKKTRTECTVTGAGGVRDVTGS